MTERWLTMDDVSTLIGRHRQSLWRYQRIGKFPEPRIIGRRRYWRLSDVQTWMADQSS